MSPFGAQGRLRLPFNARFIKKVSAADQAFFRRFCGAWPLLLCDGASVHVALTGSVPSDASSPERTRPA